jgi:Ca2+-dependent lipid-binding protein
VIPLKIPDDFIKTKTSAGEIYLQAYFLPNPLPSPTENHAPLIKQTPQDYLKQFTVTGILEIKVLFAWGLLKSDSGMTGSSADPYVRFTPVGCKEQQKTKVIENSLDPKWDESFKVSIDCNKNAGSYVKFEVWDSDTGLTDDFMGSANVKILDLYDAGGKWLVDGEFALEVPKDLKKAHSTAGKIYLQARFIAAGQESIATPILAPAPKVNFEEIVKAREAKKLEAVKGKIYVNLVKGMGLVEQDGSTSDSKCYITITGVSGDMESKVMSKDLNPKWNENFVKDISTTRGVRYFWVNKINLGSQTYQVPST